MGDRMELMSASREDLERAREEDDAVGARLGGEALKRLQRNARAGDEEAGTFDAMRIEMEFDRQRRKEGFEGADFTAVDTSQFFNTKVGDGYKHGKVVRQRERGEGGGGERMEDMRYARDKKGKKSAAELVKAGIKIKGKQAKLPTALQVQGKHAAPLKDFRLALQKRLEAKLRRARAR